MPCIQWPFPWTLVVFTLRRVMWGIFRRELSAGNVIGIIYIHFYRNLIHTFITISKEKVSFCSDDSL